MKQKEAEKKNREKNKPYEDREVLRNSHRAEKLLLLSEEGCKMMRGANLTVAGLGRAEDVDHNSESSFWAVEKIGMRGLNFSGVGSGECTALDVIP